MSKRSHLLKALYKPCTCNVCSEPSKWEVHELYTHEEGENGYVISLWQVGFVEHVDRDEHTFWFHQKFLSAKKADCVKWLKEQNKVPA